MNDQSPIWAYLIHLGFNFWNDRDAPVFREIQPYRQAQPYLRCEDKLWHDVTQRMSEIGMNMLVIDVGDGVQFASHPEIPVEGAWPIAKLKEELARLRDMGIEPIPKLNFSATHDVWLKEYSRMVSTERYYQVCRDLIAETAEIFDAPRFFHLGMDEETAEHQKHNLYAVTRQHELWWHDLFLFIDAVEKTGGKAWVWSDYIWHHQEEFLRLMPKDVLQSNWYYDPQFYDFAENDLHETWVKAYDVLEKNGYSQMPTASNYSTNSNIASTVEYCQKKIDKNHLMGFLIAPWKITLEAKREDHMAALEQIAEAKKLYEQQEIASPLSPKSTFAAF